MHREDATRKAGAQSTGITACPQVWKVPGRGEDLRLGLYVELPEGTENTSEPRAMMNRGAFSERCAIRREGGLTGGKIRVRGLSHTMTDVLVRLERLDGTSQVMRLLPSSPQFTVEPAQRALDVAHAYTVSASSTS